MRKTIPDEQGWYWVKLLFNSQWCMAFVDTGRERILMWDGDNPATEQPSRYSLDADRLRLVLGELQWYGPFQCPGGHFGGQTVIASEEQHQQAEREGKAIVLTHVDLSHCRDEQHGSCVTVTGLCFREQAAASIAGAFRDGGESRSVDFL